MCRKGETVDAWIGIDGLVKMNNLSAEGKSMTFTGLSAGGWFGEGSLLKEELRQYDVTALRDSRIAHMPKDLHVVARHQPALQPLPAHAA